MSAFAFDGDINFIGAGHYLATAKTQFTNFQLGVHVQSEYSLRFGIFQHTFFYENTGATGVSFFTGLKDQFYGSFPFIF